MRADVALLTSQRLARLEIEPVSALKPVVPEPLVERIVVDGHSARAQDLRDVASDQQRSRILKAKSKQLGMLIDDIDDNSPSRLAEVRWGFTATLRRKPKPASCPRAISTGLSGRPRTMNEP